MIKSDLIKIQNIVGNAHVPMQSDEVLDLQRFYKDFNIFCKYQPNMFPGLIYRPTSLPIVLPIFFSGKVVITGAKNMADVYNGWTCVLHLLNTYKTQKTKFVTSQNKTFFLKHTQGGSCQACPRTRTKRTKPLRISSKTYQLI